jgi:hypothetical protein
MVNDQMVNESVLSFMVTGLDEASRYNYVLSALDADGKPIHVYTGDFATLGYEGELKGGGDEVIPTPPIIPGDPDASVFTGISLPGCNTPAANCQWSIINGKLLLITPTGTFTVSGHRIE